MNIDLKSFFENRDIIFIQQMKEWGEILVNIETKNKYKILDQHQNQLGLLAETSAGLWAFILRVLLRSHRPLEIKVWDRTNQVILKLSRPFFWFFSDLNIYDKHEKSMGHAYRRFGILHKKYDLYDGQGNLFARIKSPIWRLWSFKIFDLQEREIGLITKKWGGLLKEAFTDADRFGVSFKGLSEAQKVVIFAAAISIDFDFFEDNVRN
jgi:uncharacterized protein YxjI